ncbi:acyltransferase family protein [Mesoterricola sediminis]|uniref:Acyltransferase n=1 Tax=Mesoterricola sediminis TaxID=2927980 RepID=A0AA48GZL6_9BACT|nr:acyltransferase [Mesoterricola sediminis]BDU77310.1 acyltransferase [Mesoterricola sediminis]
MRGRNPGIDLLRGLSIVLVVLHHVGMRVPFKGSALGAVLPAWFLSALAWSGYEAVFVFFVVSGYLIATNALDRWGSLAAVDLRAFYARRASRILPCLLALVAVLAALHAAGAADYVIRRPGQSLGRAVLAALGLHLNWYEGVTGYLPGNWDVLWSLSIEEVFYLAFPIAALLTRRKGVLAAILAVLALSLPWSRAALQGTPIWQEKAYLPGMAGIAMGVLAALAQARPGPDARRLLAALGGAGLFAAIFLQTWLWPVLRNGDLLLLTGSAALLVIALHARGPAPLPFTGWLQAMGRLSYEIYLTHMFIVWPIVRLAKARPGPWAFLWHVPALLAAWGLGWLVAKALSQPAERALRTRLGEA